jgi:hypothetical protein
MARKAGQIIARGQSSWLMRVSMLVLGLASSDALSLVEVQDCGVGIRRFDTHPH